MNRPSATLLRSLSASLVLLSAPVLLTGCAGFTTTSSSSPVTPQTITISGDVHGGQQPIGNAQIYLFVPGTTGYGSASTSILNTNSNASATGTNAAAYVYTGGVNNDDYVRTTSTGHFIISGDFTCPTPTSQVYALAFGGNSTGNYLNNASANNTAISLLAPLGACSTLGQNNIAINELTTVATVTALQQFMSDVFDIGTTSTNALGLTNALNVIPDLVSPTTGAVNTTNVAGTGIVPTAKINELGNILATCVNTTSSTSSACNALFSAAGTAAASVANNSATVTCPGNYTSCQTDTAGAMLQIANFPTQNVANLHNLPNSAALAFGPDGAQPNDYGLDITFTGGGITYPQSVAIDANGNAFVSNAPGTDQTGQATGSDAIVGISPRGAFIADYTSGLNSPLGIAFDLTGNLWVANVGAKTVQKFTSAGTVAAGFPATVTAFSAPLGIALDVNSNAWVTNEGNGNVVQVNSSGVNTNKTVAEGAGAQPTGIGIDSTGYVYVALSKTSKIARFAGDGTGNTLYAPSSLNQPNPIAIDASDDIWTFNQSGQLTELRGTTGATVGPAPNGANGTYQGVNNATFLAIDGAGTAWIPDCEQVNCGSSATEPDKLIHVSAQGTTLNDTNAAGAGKGLQDTTALNGVGTLAFDGSGNLWVTSAFNNNVVEYIGVAAPVLTPIVQAVSSSKLGARP